ncbi:uncharacterized protein [Ambystoma mexicanum]|uniref:uncharacterized protein isoform X2 n=1 Tax=Ambystoma mexicanum TaxID=8296 RepID=UPI0037E91244
MGAAPCGAGGGALFPGWGNAAGPLKGSEDEPADPFSDLVDRMRAADMSSIECVSETWRLRDLCASALREIIHTAGAAIETPTLPLAGAVSSLPDARCVAAETPWDTGGCAPDEIGSAHEISDNTGKEEEKEVCSAKGDQNIVPCRPTMDGDGHGVPELDQEKYDAEENVKIICLGDSAVGKSKLMERFLMDGFRPQQLSTFALTLYKYTTTVDGKTVLVDFWDTAGQERFQSMHASYYHKAHACIMVFDVQRKVTYKNLNTWYKELREFRPEIPCIVVANKIDVAGSQVILVWGRGTHVSYDFS